jgi:hypothetical protein
MVLAPGGPQNSIAQEGGESSVFKKIRPMAHKDINVARGEVFVRPDDRVVTHFDVGIG